ncbi:glycosyl transferase, group 1 [Candidatus Koribacter versatilis Ellin345]|uniref:Glycosyl transferase, group 1 n=1 Tax=Koribacter versatilis (strain Ellin345) TaxID=204669 RepID=Q1IJX4_KORVE|nr:glycosyltransferase family 1 protein [Candidatus Koribacter versatilis]ABF42826.1 glycosyl transferase, group 1 [Candidatus Koribacter versatilis Ellin345]
MATFRVGLNLIYLQPGRLGGTEVYARELLQEIEEQNQEFDFVLFLSPESYETVNYVSSRFRKVRVPISSQSPSKRHLLEQTILPRLIAREGIDLLHSMGYVCPLLAECKQVVTVHDMLYEVHPEYLSKLKLLFWRFFVPRSVRRSVRTIAVSQNAKEDIVKYCGVDSARVVAIHSGIRFQPPADEAQVTATLDKFGIKRPFVLAVGCGRHKRVDLIEEACRQLDVQLVVTGLPESRVVPHRTERTFYAGFVSAEDLRALYAAAEVYATASSMEGFGLTLLESMMQNTPVISSAAGSLREVGGDAILAIETPTSAALAKAISEVMLDRQLRDRLVNAGKQRLGQFTWKESARRHLDVYREVLSGSAERPMAPPSRVGVGG